LRAPWSRLYFPAGNYSNNNSDDWWVADLSLQQGAPYGPAFSGDILLSNIII
jgi:hypothetical protein